MANKYSKFQLQPYQSQYVDPGSVAVTGVLRKRYDDNRSSYDMLNRAANSVNTLEGDRHIKEAALKQVESDFQRTIEVGNFENSGRVVSDATNDFVGNRGLQLAQESYANRQSELSMIDKLRANGKQVLDFNTVKDTDPNSETYGQTIGHRTDSHSSYHQDANSGQMVENVYRSGSEMQLDYTQRMESLLAGIQKSGGASQIGPAEMAGFVKYMTGSGVTRSKANEVVAAALDAYIDTDEGTQDYRRLTQIDGMSEDDAKMDIVTRMQGVVEKQITGIISTPHYMKAPTAPGGQSGNGKGYSTSGGDQVKRGDIKQYSEIIADLRDKKEEFKSYAVGSDNYIAARNEIEVMKRQAKLYTKQIASQYPSLQESLKRGEDAMGNYKVLENMFLNMTNEEVDKTWNAKGLKNLWDNIFPAGEWSTNFSEKNVSSIWSHDEAEIQNFVNLFDKDGALDYINKTNGTNYTKKDIPGLKKAASKYISWMHSEGNKTIDEINDLASLKQADRIVFATNNTKALEDTNKALRQYDFSSFNFIFDTDEEREAAKKAWDEAAIEGAEGKADIIKFAGITVPSQGETGKIIIEINGARHLATFKDGDQFSDFAQKIYEDMGSPEMAENQYIAQRVEEGNFTNGEYAKMQESSMLKKLNSGADIGYEYSVLSTTIDNGTRDMLGLSADEWNALPEATKQLHREAFYELQYEIK